jgi:hypothetical protein
VKHFESSGCFLTVAVDGEVAIAVAVAVEVTVDGEVAVAGAVAGAVTDLKAKTNTNK